MARTAHITYNEVTRNANSGRYTVYPRKQFSTRTDNLADAIRLIANAGGGLITETKPLPENHPHAGKLFTHSVLNVLHAGDHHRIEGGTMTLDRMVAAGSPEAVELFESYQ